MHEIQSKQKQRKKKQSKAQKSYEMKRNEERIVMRKVKCSDFWTLDVCKKERKVDRKNRVRDDRISGDSVMISAL